MKRKAVSNNRKYPFDRHDDGASAADGTKAAQNEIKMLVRYCPSMQRCFSRCGAVGRCERVLLFTSYPSA